MVPVMQAFVVTLGDGRQNIHCFPLIQNLAGNAGSPRVARGSRKQQSGRTMVGRWSDDGRTVPGKYFRFFLNCFRACFSGFFFAANRTLPTTAPPDAAAPGVGSLLTWFINQQQGTYICDAGMLPLIRVNAETRYSHRLRLRKTS